jgi:hypothetical protein
MLTAAVFCDVGFVIIVIIKAVLWGFLTAFLSQQK